MSFPSGFVYKSSAQASRPMITGKIVEKKADHLSHKQNQWKEIIFIQEGRVILTNKLVVDQIGYIYLTMDINVKLS